MKKKAAVTTQRLKSALKALNLDLFRAETITRPAPATMYAKIREHSKRLTDPKSISIAVGHNESPEEKHLSELFDKYNWMYFGGQLPSVRIIWSSRMMSAGSYSPSERTIRISKKYHAIFPAELDDTLKHEMIHIKHFHHDADFKREAKRIGASLRAQSHPSLRKSPRYLYACPSCSTEFPRQKKMRMASCGRCSGGRFDERHKLRLKRSFVK